MEEINHLVDEKNKIRKIKDWLYSKVKMIDKGNCVVVYHYTSPEGFDGILCGREDKNPVFGFSRYDLLNDESEGNDVLDVFNRVRDAMLKEKNISEQFYNLLNDISFNEKYFFSYDAEPVNENGEEIKCSKIDFLQGKPYLCCFSKDKDCLSMWKYYAKEESYNGYNIGVDLHRFNGCEDEKSSNQGYILNILEVVYLEEEKEAIMTELISRMYGVYNDKFFSDNDIKKNIISFLYILRFSFKKQCFKEENEVRMLLIIPDEPIKTHGARNFEIYYRYKGPYIIPYIEFEFEEKACITSVGFGPMVNGQRKEHKEEILKEKLSKYGYKRTKIYPSNIPVRY